MRAAPPVSVDADDGGVGRVAVALLCALAAAVALRWAWQWLAVPLEGLSALGAGDLFVAALGALACGTWVWRRVGAGPVRLWWDGAAWHWQADGRAPVTGRARVVFDLGRWLLLAFDPEPPAQGGPQWEGLAAWPLRHRAARRWRLLDDASAQAARAALYAAAPALRAGE